MKSSRSSHYIHEMIIKLSSTMQDHIRTCKPDTNETLNNKNPI